LKSRTQSFARLRLESLEDRIQPSGLLHATAQPLAPLEGRAEIVSFGGQSAAQPPDVSFGTYVTGNTHASTAGGVTVDSSGSAYVVGSAVLDLMGGGTDKFGYIAKYQPGTTTLDPTFNGGAILYFRITFTIGGVPTTYGIDLHGVTVDTDPAQQHIDVVGVGTNAANGNRLGVMAVVDQTGMVLGAVGFGATTGTALNSLDGASGDGSGDVVATGQFFINGTANLGFVILPDGTTSVQGYYYDFTPDFTSSAGYGIASDAGANYVYVAGTVTEPGSSTLEGMAGRIDVNAMFDLTFYNVLASDITAGASGDVVFKAAAVHPTLNGQGYVAGTAPALGGGTNAVALQFDFVSDNPINTYVSADPTSSASGIAVNQTTGDVYLVGSAQDPVTSNSDVLLVHLGSSLAFVNSAELGTTDGSGDSTGTGIALDSSGNVLAVGTTAADDFPMVTGTLNGPTDGVFFSYSGL
jgi:hypothetical protein